MIFKPELSQPLAVLRFGKNRLFLRNLGAQRSLAASLKGLRDSSGILLLALRAERSSCHARGFQRERWTHTGLA